MSQGYGWFAYAPGSEETFAGGAGPSGPSVPSGRPGPSGRPDPGRRPELADVGRLARRGLDVAVKAARANEQPSVARFVRDHLGGDATAAEIADERWAPYEGVNVQRAVDAWLAASPQRRHELIGLPTGMPEMGLAEFMTESNPYGMPTPTPTNVARVNLTSGPDGESLPCVRAGLYLVEEGEVRTAIAVRQASPQRGLDKTVVEVVSTDPDAPVRVTAQLRRLADELNVYRGHVLSFAQNMFAFGDSALTFHPRPALTRDDLVLDDELLAGIERQVVGVARHRAALLAAGQHLKRGLLLYGPPGVGKTHTIRYLTSRLPDTTVVMISGEALEAIGLACSVARSLQPSVVVVEDVDLIAEDRGMHPGQHPLLFQLLNEMDGLSGDSDVAFVLTTNRADLLEPALAARPGRIDQAIELELPDLSARRRLFDLYRGRLRIEAAESDIEEALQRAEGVTASFLKELLRRAALYAAERAAGAGGDHGADPAGGIVVTADDLRASVDDLLSSRNRMTRVMLGSEEGRTRPDDADPPWGVPVQDGWDA
ncbi:ATP-binding protein [Agilicoccus flavus]|uniref:ATP-binding protein n=1 Tax=Agilicoccus flavus TaxID=2775968 RepID=UPI001CF6889E|nr:ATP-binding protein [Agilicoccus flavus]